MKLNLLPTYVSKEKQAKTAVIAGVLVALAGIGGAVFMMIYSQGERDKAVQAANDLRPQHQQVVALAKSADTIIASAQTIILNINLAEAMVKHNTVYPDLYDEVRQYIPGFYRITSMSAAPSGPEGCTVTLTGVLQTQQQYADLMLALLRIPNVTTVSRAGYQSNAFRVPGLSEIDQVGRPLRPGQTPIPDDPAERLQWYIAQGSVDGFSNVSGFGSGEPDTKGPMPDWSEVTVAINLARNITTPEPRSTLGTVGAAPAPAGGVPNPAATTPGPAAAGGRGPAGRDEER